MTTLIKLNGQLHYLFIALLLACFAIPQSARAVSPPPDGGYPLGNTAEGEHALLSLTIGGYNTAVGFSSLSANTEGFFNTAVGAGALWSNTAIGNTAVGAAALLLNTTGIGNTAVGTAALARNNADPDIPDSGSGNTAVGGLSLTFNTTGFGNTAVGSAALLANTGGSGNTAVGSRALQDISNVESNLNTAVGAEALNDATEGSDNTAVGGRALKGNTTGFANTAVGRGALMFSTTGSHNIAVGSSAGNSVTTEDYNIHIGSEGVDGDANTIRIGATFSPAPSPSPSAGQNRTFIAGIRGTAVVGDPVVVDANGQLGTATSSARFKKDIKPMDKTSEAILSLKPVNFQYKSDTKGIPQFGLIAEEVAKVNQDLVVRDRNGDIYSVRYEAVNAMLLNEFLKEHKKVEQQQAVISQLESTVAKQEATTAHQQKQIEALTAGLHKVSAQLELSKPAPQTVLNNQ
jgi:uncharacterized coiled-coil protein SlyX